MRDGYTVQYRNFRWPDGVGLNGVTKAGEGSEGAKLTGMVTTVWYGMVWLTLHDDGLKSPFSSANDILVFTALYFDLKKREAESTANVAALDMLTIAYKKAGRGGD